MSCTQRECLQTSKTCVNLSIEALSRQLNECNKCVMIAGGIKKDVEVYKRTTRGNIGLLYAQKYFY